MLNRRTLFGRAAVAAAAMVGIKTAEASEWSARVNLPDEPDEGARECVTDGEGPIYASLDLDGDEVTLYRLNSDGTMTVVDRVRACVECS